MTAERNIREECKQAVLTAVSTAQSFSNNGDGIDHIMDVVDQWIGSLDRLFRKLGRAVPVRPNDVYLGFSDALYEVDPSQIKTTYVITLLTMGNNVQDRLPGYASFYYRAKAHFEQTRPAEAFGLLAGLKPR